MYRPFACRRLLCGVFLVDCWPLNSSRKRNNRPVRCKGVEQVGKLLCPAALLPPGDIVICTRPIQADENIIKRVTAVEGQQVNVFRPGQLTPVQVKV